jgi:hypothetical protein
MSVKDRLESKMYIVVWQWESQLTASMMISFPSTVTRYMHRKSPKRMGCRFDSSDRRDGILRLLLDYVYVLLGHLLKKNKRWKKEVKRHLDFCIYFEFKFSKTLSNNTGL